MSEGSYGCDSLDPQDPSPKEHGSRLRRQCLRLVLGSWVAAVVPVGLHSQAVTDTVRINVSGSAAGGSSSFVIADGRLAFERVDTAYYEFRVSVHGRYGKSGGDVIAKDWGAEIGFDATPRGRLSLFALADVEQNPVRELRVRARMGLGAKWMLMRKSSRNRTSISAALLTAFEKHDAEAMGTSTWRWSVRLKRDLTVASKIELSTMWFWQPRVDDLGDYLLDGETRLKLFQITERVGLTLTHDYFYDSVPPDGIQKTEQRLLFGVDGSF